MSINPFRRKAAPAEAGAASPPAPPDPKGIQWAPGALDGVLSHHTLHRDPIAVEVEKVQAAGLAPAAIHRRAVELATRGTEVTQVKLGIALLGLLPGNPERDLLLRLGRDEELTKYCVAAIAATDPDPERTLVELGRAVRLWGRVHVVERLRRTTDPQIKRWILLEGFGQSALDGYLAGIAAETGELERELAADPVEEAVLDAAGRILSTLIDYPPAENIDDYEAAPRVIGRYVSLIEDAPARSQAFVTMLELLEFFDRDDWDERYADVAGWTPELRAELRERCVAITRRPEWRAVAERGLLAAEWSEYHAADRIAHTLGLPTFDAHFGRVQANPSAGSWWMVMRDVDAERLPAVLAYARQLDLGHDLRTVVAALDRFPGAGFDFVAAALQSSQYLTRNAAVRTLETWGRERWPAEAGDVLRQRAAAEPDPEIRDRIIALLNELPGAAATSS